MRVVGLDLGEARIGVAVSDGAGVLAVGHAVLARSGDPAGDRAAIARLVDDLGAKCVVVGLPLSLDGTTGRAAQAVEAEVAALAAVLPVPVETYDERLTTVSAGRALAAAGVPARKRRAVVDQVAATVILQSWLDRNRREEMP